MQLSTISLIYGYITTLNPSLLSICDLVGSSEDLDPLFDRSKLLIASRSSRFTKGHNSTRLPILGQAQQLQKPSVDILVHSSEMLERSSETLFRESGPDDVLKDTG
jgi:hypothetical protein